jgi:hypothetical protein
MKEKESDALRAIEVLQSRQKWPLLQDDELKRADYAARGVVNSGLTNDKSFKSGVDAGDTPGAELSNSGSRENSLKLHERDGHSRDLSTLTPTHENRVRRGPQIPPRVANASSKSLKMTSG